MVGHGTIKVASEIGGIGVHWNFILEELGGRGGVESVLDMVVAEIESLGHHVTLYLPVPTENPVWNARIDANTLYYDPVSLNADARDWPLLYRRIAGLRRLLEIHGRGDVIVATHMPVTVLYARMAAGETDAPPIVSWLHNPAATFYHPEWINYADLHWAIANGLAEDMAPYLSPSRLIYWVGNPIVPTAHVIRISEEPRFVFVGRLENRQKRVDLLLNALSTVSFAFRLDLYGDGPDRETLQTLAEKLGIAAQCVWHGWVDRPWEAIEEASCLVLTSDFEGFPMVIGQSLSRGLPVIASDCNFGPRELVRPGLNGSLFPPGDAAALTALLEDAVGRRRFRDWSHTAKASVAGQGADRVVERMLRSLRYFIPVTGTAL